MRGTLDRLIAKTVKWRFIPAYAGNTEVDAPYTEMLAVHPRVCGEHLNEEGLKETIPGSSPRMRGTRYQSYPCGCNRRFIPAYAGNTIDNASNIDI